jgi:broad specificity phosphatase PhoE
MKLYLVRHGRSAGNLPGRMTGWSEHPLTPLGTSQARRVAARLAPLGPMPVYSSDLPRALDTARLIAARWAATTAAEPVAGAASGAAAQAAVGVLPDRRLREIDLGDFEGRSWDEFAADRELAGAFAREPLATALPGGESLAMVRKRVLVAFEEIVRGDRAVVCLVSHDGPIRTILNHVLGVPPERHWALSTSHGGLSLLETSRAWISVRFVNDTSHLRGLDTSADDATAAEVPVRAIEHAAEDAAGHQSEGAADGGATGR